jgi:tetratricopeptide (TPR) repeat protein
MLTNILSARHLAMFLNAFSARHLAICARGGLDELLEVSFDILKVNPNDREALFTVGSIHASRQQWREAIHFLERLRQLDPNDVTILDDLSVCYWNHKKIPSCYKALIRRLELDPSSWSTYDRLCVVAKTLGLKDEAVLYGEGAVRLGGSTYAGPLNNLGCAYMDGRRYTLAEPLLLRAIALEKDSVLFMENLALAYINQGRIGEARVIVDCLIARGNDGVRVHYLLGLCYEREERLIDAVIELRACLARDPGYCEALRILGRVFFKKNDLRESISSYILAEAMLAELDGQDYQMMGDVYSKDGSYIEAIATYEKSIAISPCPDPNCAVGSMCFKHKIFAEMKEHHSESALLDPGYLDSQYDLSTLHLDEDTLTKCRTCLNTQAGYVRIRRALAGVLLRRGHFANALVEVSIALRSDPEDSDALYIQGCIYARMGDRDQSIHALEACLGHLPSHKGASELLSELHEKHPDHA